MCCRGKTLLPDRDILVVNPATVKQCASGSGNDRFGCDRCAADVSELLLRIKQRITRKAIRIMVSGRGGRGQRRILINNIKIDALGSEAAAELGDRRGVAVGDRAVSGNKDEDDSAAPAGKLEWSDRLILLIVKHRIGRQMDRLRRWRSGAKGRAPDQQDENDSRESRGLHWCQAVI